MAGDYGKLTIKDSEMQVKKDFRLLSPTLSLFLAYSRVPFSTVILTKALELYLPFLFFTDTSDRYSDQRSAVLTDTYMFYYNVYSKMIPDWETQSCL